MGLDRQRLGAIVTAAGVALHLALRDHREARKKLGGDRVQGQFGLHLVEAGAGQVEIALQAALDRLISRLRQVGRGGGLRQAGWRLADETLELQTRAAQIALRHGARRFGAGQTRFRLSDVGFGDLPDLETVARGLQLFR